MNLYINNIFTTTIHMEKYFPERVGLHRRLLFQLYLYSLWTQGLLEAEHEKGDNFELQLRERKHSFEGIIVSTGKNSVGPI